MTSPYHPSRIPSEAPVHAGLSRSDVLQMIADSLPVVAELHRDMPFKPGHELPDLGTVVLSKRLFFGGICVLALTADGYTTCLTSHDGTFADGGVFRLRFAADQEVLALQSYMVR